MHDARDDNAGVQDTGARHVTVRQRHAEMIRMVRETGFATIQSLADHFGITPAVRAPRHQHPERQRACPALSRRGRPMPEHGEHGLSWTARCSAWPRRSVIGQMVAEAIPNKSSLFINIGTTTEAIAQALVKHNACG
jgi:DeoR family transcriptional regulator, glycerol-3-phosphate regulon repressor